MQADPQEFNQAELQRRAHLDLSKRARGGIVIYLLGWLVLSLPSSIHAHHPNFFYLNTAILVIIMLVRIAHLLANRAQKRISAKIRRRWLVWGILAGALHWGLLTFWVLTHPVYASIEFHLIASAAVLGIAGTMTLSIAREIRFLYPLFILAPIFAALVARGSADDLVLATMVVLAVAYVIVTAKTSSQDYWQAIGNQLLAEQRAVQMEKLSITDQLTQLNNRLYFDRRFSEEWKRGSRQNTPLSVLMIDLDHFKALNDTHGHLFGDRCLKLVALALSDEIKRETDILARYGGEEFVVLLTDTDAAGAAQVGERLRVAIETSEILNNGERACLSCSVGGASTIPDHRFNSELLLKRADVALYRAKSLGRNRYTAAEDETIEMTARIEAGQGTEPMGNTL